MTFTQAAEVSGNMSQPEREAADIKAIKKLPCGFCGAKPGESCHIQLYDRERGRVLPGFAHKGRQLEYLIMAEMEDLLGEEPLSLDDML